MLPLSLTRFLIPISFPSLRIGFILLKKTGLICESVKVKSGVNNILIEVGNVSAEDAQESNL